MEELVPLFDPEGSSLGICSLKSEAHRYGWWHGTVHVWLVSVQGQLLFQKRSPNKLVFPSLLDVSVAGHITGWESPEDAAVREVKEELGLLIQPDYLLNVGCFSSEEYHTVARITDREHHQTYVYQQKVAIEDLKPDPLEVSDIFSFPLETLLQTSRNTMGKFGVQEFVPHSKAYKRAIFEAVKKLVQ